MRAFVDEEYYDCLDEAPDPEGPEMRCTNEECIEDTYFATVLNEWQGTREMGGPVKFMDDDGCPTCHERGEEI